MDELAPSPPSLPRRSSAEPGAPPLTAPPAARRGRWISASGLIGLGLAFFLPQIHGCRANVVPFDEVFGEIGLDGIHTLAFLPFFFAFAMLAIYLLRALFRGARARRVLPHVACVVMAATCLICCGVCAVILRDARGSWSLSNPALLWTWSLVASAAAGTAMTAWICVKGPPPARIAAFVSLGGFASLGYLIFFAGMALYGLWVSLVSCALMGVGGFLEAEALWDSS